MGVSEYVDRKEALEHLEGNMVNVKGVRVNNGTQDNPVARCRLVFAGELFAGTPSLVVVKKLLHMSWA